jgi:hypothetical protein
LTTTVLALAADRKLQLSSDAETELRGAVACAVSTLAAEDRIGDDAAVELVSANLERLIDQIQSLEPEPLRGRPRPPVTGLRVKKALNSLCPGFWPFC